MSNLPENEALNVGDKVKPILELFPTQYKFSLDSVYEVVEILGYDESFGGEVIVCKNLSDKGLSMITTSDNRVERVD